MKKRFLLTSALMLLLTVLALTSATYAWFTMSTTNRVNDFTMTAASADGGLEISIDGQVFNNQSVSIANPTLTALDITTADGKTFYRAKADTVDQTTGAVKEVTTTGVAANQSYFQYDLYFRTSVAGTIYLDLGRSYIIPESLASKLTQTGNPYTFAFAAKDADSTNQSALGSFTRDWIAAATRISYEVTGYQYGLATTALQAGDTNTTVTAYTTNAAVICEPFATSAALIRNTVTNTWQMSEQKVAQTLQGLANLDTPNATDKKLVDGNAYTTQKLLSNDADPAVWTINGNNFYNGATAIVKVTLRVWIEGQDDEAKAALAMGQFRTGLTFYLTPNAIDDTIKVTYSNGNKVMGKQYVPAEDDNPATEIDVVTGFTWAQKSSAIESLVLYNGNTPVVVTGENAVGTQTETSFTFNTPISVEDAANYKLRVYCKNTVNINGKDLAVEIFDVDEGEWVKVSTLTNKYFVVDFE